VHFSTVLYHLRRAGQPMRFAGVYPRAKDGTSPRSMGRRKAEALADAAPIVEKSQPCFQCATPVYSGAICCAECARGERWEPNFI